MSSWTAIGSDSWEAAKLLLNGTHHRSCCSRAYFAGYALLTGLFRRMSVTFSHGDNNPSHDQLYALVTHNLPRDQFPLSQRRELKQQLRLLLRNRLAADYEPNATVDRTVALLSVRSASRMAQLLEATP